MSEPPRRVRWGSHAVATGQTLNEERCGQVREMLADIQAQPYYRKWWGYGEYEDERWPCWTVERELAQLVYFVDGSTADLVIVYITTLPTSI